jgi:hypothetical protein
MTSLTDLCLSLKEKVASIDIDQNPTVSICWDLDNKLNSKAAKLVMEQFLQLDNYWAWHVNDNTFSLN